MKEKKPSNYVKKVLIVSSPTCEPDKTQTSLVYLGTILQKLHIDFEILDLSGTIDYFDAPKEFYTPCDSQYWLSSRIFYEASWLDNYLPDLLIDYDAILYSALFSPDILIHSRHSLNQRKYNSDCISVIGGSALSALNNEQLSIISEIFDYVCIGVDVESLITQVMQDDKFSTHDSVGQIIRNHELLKVQPEYKLVNIKDFVTVYSGHGCNWGNCRFCNSSKIYNKSYYFRPATEIADDFEKISNLNSKISDVMLSSDSFTKKNIFEVASLLKQKKINIPYNIMLRGGEWITEEFGELLRESGCTDVFIGAEALNDDILSIINKGINSHQLIRTVEILSKYVKVIIGLILFIPHITEKQLNEQLSTLEKLLPCLTSIEPEILSVVNRSEFADYPTKYGMKLWETEKNINDSWCYGLSADIPWTFENDRYAKIWFDHCKKLQRLTDGLVQSHYWHSVDDVRSRF